jgi:hypothetical protein
MSLLTVHAADFRQSQSIFIVFIASIQYLQDIIESQKFTRDFGKKQEEVLLDDNEGNIYIYIFY